MRTLLWILLVFMQCNLWAASSSEVDLCISAAGRSACARPDSPDDYTPATLAEAVEFCTSVARDNIIWIQGLQEYWAEDGNQVAVKKILLQAAETRQRKEAVSIDSSLNERVIALGVQSMMDGYASERAEWESGLVQMDLLTSDSTQLPFFLNQIIDQLRVRQKDFSELEYGAKHPEVGYISHLYPSNLLNTKAQLESLKTIFKILLLFATPKYQEDYAMAHFEYRGTGNKNLNLDVDKEKGITEISESDGFFFNIITRSGQHIKLPLEKDFTLFAKDFIAAERLAIGIVSQMSELKITFPSQLEFILNALPVGKAAEYEKSYRAAKTKYAAFLEKKASRGKKSGGGSKAAAVAEDSRDLDALLAELGESPAPKQKKKACGKKSGTSVADAAHEAASLEAARAAEIAAAEAAAKKAERQLLRDRTLALAAAQRELPPLEGGFSFPATERPRASIGSAKLSSDNRDMLSDLMRHEVPARTYDWHALTNLLGNLGFKRQGTNFVGLDATGKRKQIGLHYLHGDESLNPHLVQIMFKQLHGSVELGRAALGRLAGIVEPLDPWSWESDPR